MVTRNGNIRKGESLPAELSRVLDTYKWQHCLQSKVKALKKPKPPTLSHLIFSNRSWKLSESISICVWLFFR